MTLIQRRFGSEKTKGRFRINFKNSCPQYNLIQKLYDQTSEAIARGRIDKEWSENERSNTDNTMRAAKENSRNKCLMNEHKTKINEGI